MAQTIAIQRGTGTVASGNSLTMFTQSGGSGTRVIFNMCTFYGSDGVMSYPATNIVHVSSSGGSSVVGYTKNGTSSIWSSQYNPANNAYGPVQVGGNTGSILINGVIQGNNGSGYVTSYNAYYTQIQTNNSAFTMYMPSNFWIGPSDSVRFDYYDNNGRTAQVAWSFTTITES